MEDWLNGFEAVLKDRTALADSYIKMLPVPAIEADHYGRLVLEDNSKDNFEIIKFNRVDATGVYVETANGGVRNENGNSNGIHPKGARIRMNVTAQALRDIRDNAQNIVDSSGNPVVASVTTATTLTPNLTNDINNVSALASALTIAAPTGTPRDLKVIQFRIYDDGTARAITWNAIYVGIGVTLPTTTTPGQTLYVAGRYNAAKTKYHILAVARG